MLVDYKKASAVLKLMESSPQSTASEIAKVRAQLNDPQNLREANTDNGRIEVPDWAAKSQPSDAAIRARAQGETLFDPKPVAPFRSVYDARHSLSRYLGPPSEAPDPPESPVAPAAPSAHREPSWSDVQATGSARSFAVGDEVPAHLRLQPAPADAEAAATSLLSVSVTKLSGDRARVTLLENAKPRAVTLEEGVAGIKPNKPFTATYELDLGNPKHKVLYERVISPEFQADILKMRQAHVPLGGTMAEMRRPSMADIVNALSQSWTKP